MANNPMLPPGMNPKPAWLNPPIPQPPTGTGLGFQNWASDPQNNMKVQHSLSSPDAPLQPGAQPGAAPMAAATPPQPPPMASAAPPQVNNIGGLAAGSGPDIPSAVAPSVQSGAQAQLGADQAELQRLRSTGSGASQVKNPFLRTLAEIGNVAAPFILGRAGALIPGTTQHNWMLQAQDRQNIAGDQSAVNEQFGNAQKQAETNLANANAGAIPAKLEADQDKVDAGLAQHGLTRDVNGNITPDANSPVFQQQQLKNNALQAQAAYVQAGQQLREVQAALVAAKNDPNSPAYRQAQQMQDRLTAMLPILKERSDSYMGRYLESAYGKGLNGDVLPGSILTNDGQPVGTANAVNVRPTAQQRGKSNMATSAQEQLNDIVSILQKNPTMFGPGYGQSTQFQKWIGAHSPDAQRFASARTIAADHLAATFGGRSEAALQALDKAIGEYKDNPQAAIAGIQQLEKANRVFQKAGSYRTAGGNPSNPSPSKPNSMKPPAAAAPAGATMKVPGSDGKLHWSDGKRDLGVAQ